MSDWSELKDFDNLTDYNGNGVYKILLYENEETPTCIPRFLGEDENGILMIGKSKNIKKRLNYFIRAACGRSYSHAEGKRLSIIKNECPEYKSDFDNYELFYCFKRLDSDKEMDKEEEILLKCYFKRFGEIPPLNNNLPNRDKEWNELGCKNY